MSVDVMLVLGVIFLLCGAGAFIYPIFDKLYQQNTNLIELSKSVDRRYESICKSISTLDYRIQYLEKVKDIEEFKLLNKYQHVELLDGNLNFYNEDTVRQDIPIPDNRNRGVHYYKTFKSEEMVAISSITQKLEERKNLKAKLCCTKKDKK